jgi:hypothetical protein
MSVQRLLQSWCIAHTDEESSRRITSLFFVPLCLSFGYELVKGHACGSHESSLEEQATPENRLTGPTPLLVSWPSLSFPMLQ